MSRMEGQRSVIPKPNLDFQKPEFFRFSEKNKISINSKKKKPIGDLELRIIDAIAHWAVGKKSAACKNIQKLSKKFCKARLDSIGIKH
jgi:hypothetical protein